MDAQWPDDVEAVTALLARDTAHPSALLDDLLSLLDDDATSSDAHSSERSLPPSPQRAPRTKPPAPQPVRKRGVGGSAQLKRSLESLRAESQQLSTELTRLQSTRTRSAAMERALAERFKRRRAEDERQQLRDAVLTHRRFLHGLQSVFSMPPSFTAGLNMCNFLHNYTRLTRDKSTRWREYAALAEESRLRAAMDILCRETEQLTVSDDYDTLSPSLDAPYIQTEMCPDRGGFGVTTTTVFAIDSHAALGEVLQAACVAARDLMSTCPAYPTKAIAQTIVDPDAPAAAVATSKSDLLPPFLYRAMDVSYTSLDAVDALLIESRSLTIRKLTNGAAVVVWDFVDDDELHPTCGEVDITRQASGACLIRRELCADGLERTVYRSLSTRRYRYHARADRDALRRYYLDSRRRMRTNELLFRELMLSALAAASSTSS